MYLLETVAPVPADGLFSLAWLMIAVPLAVSYTHLTLPTIYSV